MIISLLFALLFLVKYSSSDCIDFAKDENFCYHEMRNQNHLKLNKRITYEIGKAAFVEKYKNSVAIEPGCKPVMIYLIARHGVTNSGEWDNKTLSDLRDEIITAADA